MRFRSTPMILWRAVANYLDGAGAGQAKLAGLIRRSNGFA